MSLVGHNSLGIQFLERMWININKIIFSEKSEK